MLSFAFLGQGEIPYVSSVSLSLIMKVILLVVVAHSLYMEERKAEKKKKVGLVVLEDHPMLCPFLFMYLVCF